MWLHSHRRQGLRREAQHRHRLGQKKKNRKPVISRSLVGKIRQDPRCWKFILRPEWEERLAVLQGKALYDPYDQREDGCLIRVWEAGRAVGVRRG